MRTTKTLEEKLYRDQRVIATLERAHTLLCANRLRGKKIRVVRAIAYEGDVDALLNCLGRSLPDGLRPLAGPDGLAGYTIEVMTAPMEILGESDSASVQLSKDAWILSLTSSVLAAVRLLADHTNELRVRGETARQLAVIDALLDVLDTLTPEDIALALAPEGANQPWRVQ